MTLKEIAEQTGYSIATVSRVLNGTGNSKESSKSYIEISEFARMNGYSRSQKPSGLVATIVPDIGNPITTAIIKTIQSICDKEGLSLIIVNTNESAEQESNALRHLTKLDLYGVVYSPVSETKSIDFISYKSGHRNVRAPVVLIGRELSFANYDSVYINNKAGAFDATKYLLKKGYLDIAVIAGPKDTKPGRERLEGFLKAYEYFDLTARPDRILFGDFTTASGYHQTKAILRSGDLPEAIIPMNNLMTRGCYQALTEAKITVGMGEGEMAMVSFDGDELLEAMGVEIPYIKRPTTEMGRIAMNLLFSRAGADNQNAPIQRIELSPILTVPNKKDYK